MRRSLSLLSPAHNRKPSGETPSPRRPFQGGRPPGPKRHNQGGCLMFNSRSFDNSRPDGVAVLELIPDPEEPRGSPPRFVPLKRTELTGEVAGPLGSLRVRHVFGYSRQQCDRVLEAVYRFPLPGDAAVTGVRVRFGDVEIRASLKERQRAEQEYDEAKRQGRQAALLTRESPDVFTLQVAGLQPDQEVAVETDYVQIARAEGPGWTLRVPLTTSPRYVRGDELASRHAQGQPLFLLRDPGHRFALDVLFSGGIVQSPTHRLATTPEGDGLRVRLEEGDVLPDRDCVLTWQPKRVADRPALHVLLHDDPPSDSVYFLAMVAPPNTQPTGSVARETILLVDHSGSMEGPKWAAADWAVKKFLSTLGGHDTFNLGLFHNSPRWFAKGMQQASPDAVKQAVAFLEEHKDTGGTELGVALEQALSKPRFKGDAARHVLILTDAEVSDAGRILRLADEEAAKSDRRRIDVLCIDAAPNSFLASERAARGGGVSKFLTSDPAEEDITTALDEVLADWDQPVLANLKLEVNRTSVQAAGRAVDGSGSTSVIDLGDLPSGRCIWVAGRAPRKDGEMAFRMMAGKKEVAAWRGQVREGTARPGLKALFGSRRLNGLEFLIHSGYAGVEVQEQLSRLGFDTQRDLSVGRKVYAENQRNELDSALKKLLVREALEYGLASSETAFVAVRTEAGRPVQGTVAVANAVPSGWSDQFLGGGGYVGGTKLCMAAGPAAASADSMLQRLDAGSEDEDIARSFQGSGPPRRKARKSPAAPYPPQALTASLSASAKLSKSVQVPSPSAKTIFDGAPAFQGGEAVLLDSGRGEDAGRIPETGTLSALRLEFSDGPPAADSLDAGLTLLVFIDELASPRARVRLADLVRQGGERPLNLSRTSGQRVRIVLNDGNGVWARAAPKLRVSLRWN